MESQLVLIPFLVFLLAIVLDFLVAYGSCPAGGALLCDDVIPDVALASVLGIVGSGAFALLQRLSPPKIDLYLMYDEEDGKSEDEQQQRQTSRRIIAYDNKKSRDGSLRKIKVTNAHRTKDPDTISLKAGPFRTYIIHFYDSEDADRVLEFLGFKNKGL
jgi:hypothetical protein